MKFRPIKNLKLGKALKDRVFLAPMEEVNDVAFRLMCKKAGCSLTWTGMTHPRTKQKTYFDDKPICQLFCKTPEGIKEFVKKHNKKVSGWDFNLGCPATTARKHGFGSYMISELKTIEEILKEIRKAAGKKKAVFVKIRKSAYAKKILKLVEKYCDAIIVHPRTQQQGYSGIPEEKFAEKLRDKTKLPVVYSGNVGEKNYKELLKKFDYVMVGRSAIGNPGIFSDISGKKKSGLDFKDYLKLSKKYKFPFRLLKFQAMNFTKGKKDAKEKRLEIFEVKTEKRLRKLKL